MMIRFALIGILGMTMLLPATGLVWAQNTDTTSSGDESPVTPPGDESQVTPPSSGSTIDNPLGENTSLIGFFNEILDVILIFAVPIIVLFIMFAGFKYVTARGNKDEISTANKALLYAVIGGVLILGANVLLEVISGTIDALGQ